MPSTLPFINYPVEGYELEYANLTPIQYGGLHRLNSKQWIMDMKPIPLDNPQWVKTVTGWNEAQRKRNLPIIKEHFKEHGGGKGYYSILLELEWYTKYNKYITSSEKGKKGAEAKRLLAEKRRSEELTTNVEGTSDTKLTPENKESGSAELKQEKKKEDNKKEDNILNSKETHEVGNQISHSPLSGSEKPDDLKKVVKDVTKSFNANYQEKVNSPKSYLDNMFDEFWANLQANTSGDTMLRYEDWKGYLDGFLMDEIGQHWYDSEGNLKTTTNLFKNLAR